MMGCIWFNPGGIKANSRETLTTSISIRFKVRSMRWTQSHRPRTRPRWSWAISARLLPRQASKWCCRVTPPKLAQTMKHIWVENRWYNYKETERKPCSGSWKAAGQNQAMVCQWLRSTIMRLVSMIHLIARPIWESKEKPLASSQLQNSNLSIIEPLWVEKVWPGERDQMSPDLARRIENRIWPLPGAESTRTSMLSHPPNITAPIIKKFETRYSKTQIYWEIHKSISSQAQTRRAPTLRLSSNPTRQRPAHAHLK